LPFIPSVVSFAKLVPMSRDLKSELGRIFPERVAADGTLILTVQHLFERFCKELGNISVTDPLKQRIFFRIENFPYLIKLEHYNEREKKWTDARANAVIKALQEGTFNPAKHRFDAIRAKGLFWIRDILTRPDAIHENICPRVTGELVYVRRLRGRTGLVKVVLTTHNRAGEWVLVTSFYAGESWLRRCAKGPALYVK